MGALGRIVVVGGSLAGLRAAEALRREGFAGELTLVGQEPHLPYDRPPLSKQLLRGTWGQERVVLCTEERAGELGLALSLGAPARALDAAGRRILLDDGRALPFDGLVIATGASPRRLAFGHGLSGVHALRTIDDALAIRAALAARPRVCVVGAGFIGLEVAATCRALGLEVTVVEPMPVPLAGKLGEPMAQHVLGLHRAQGVTLRTGTSVTALEGDGAVQRVRLADGGVLEADLVVVGIGVRPCVEWLEGSGVALDDGVLCDATTATSLPSVVAAGDCARWPNARFSRLMRVEHWTHAVEMASHAARRLLGGDAFVEPFVPVPYFWTDQYDLKIQFAGDAAPGDQLVLVEGPTADHKLVALYAREGALCGVLAIGRPAQLVRYRAMIAAGASLQSALPAT